MKAALCLHKMDTVATMMEPVQAGESVAVVDTQKNLLGQVVALSDIEQGHKIALRTMEKGTDVIKYGYSIGVASVSITPGERVHIHNLDSRRGRGDLV